MTTDHRRSEGFDMTLKVRTEAEAITDILTALERRAKAGEFDYTSARKLSDSTPEYLAECRASRDQARAALREVQAIAETIAPEMCMSPVGSYSGSAPEMCAQPLGHEDRCRA